MRKTAPNGIPAEEFTLEWTLYGTSTDDSCKGPHPDYTAASVSLQLLDGGRTLQAVRNCFINASDDTASWKRACVSGSPFQRRMTTASGRTAA